MRTRQRTIVDVMINRSALSSAYKDTNCAGGVTTGTATIGAISAPVKGFKEGMNDELGKKSDHPVTHRRMTWDFTASRAFGKYAQQTGVAGIREWQDISSTDWWPRASYNDVLVNVNHLGGMWIPGDVGFLPLPPERWSYSSLSSDDESVLRENCFEKARQLKADLLLDIVEANQVWPSITSLATSLPLIKSQWPKLRRVLKSYAGRKEALLRELDGLRRIARNVSGGFLAWKFGALPLLMDLEDTRRFLPKIGSDYERFVQGDIQRFSSSAELVTSCDVTPFTVSAFSQPHLIITPIGRIIAAPTVRYVLRVRPRQAVPVSSFNKKLEHVLSRFATSPTSLAWELVPFSFVADWFVDLRGFLRQADDIAGFSPYEVVGFTRSFSYKLDTGFTREVRSSCASGPVYSKGFSGNVEYSHYDRARASVTPNLVSWKPRFGKSQAGITAALIAQQLLKIRRA